MKDALSERRVVKQESCNLAHAVAFLPHTRTRVPYIVII